MSDIHEKYMQRALIVAENAKYICSPNPMVGAVIVKNKKIIGEGFTHQPGKDHAEIDAIKDVKSKFKENSCSQLKGSSLYVTLEPCSKKGRTPPCTKEIIKAGIGKIFIASKDPMQSGLEELIKAGIKVETGICEKESNQQNRGFFSRINRSRPFITCKIACSVDGGIGTIKGEDKWITSKESRKDVHYLRAQSDAILTGIGTVIADNPQLNVRVKELKDLKVDLDPKRYVLDSNLRLKGNEVLLKDGGKTTVFCKQAKNIKDLSPSVNIIEIPGNSKRVPIKNVLSFLNKENCNNLMIEAGKEINSSFINSKLIDEFIFYIAPKILGKDKINFSDFDCSFSNIGTIQLQINDIEEIGKDFKVTATPIYN